MLISGCDEVAVITPEATPAPPTQPPIASPQPTEPPTAAPVARPTQATATPTITPTPLIHVIESGDTLGSVAAQYGVSVQALQAANGIENPLLLQIGQELVIPIGEETEDQVPGLLLPTPTPLPFSVRGVGFYKTPVGSLWCLGEVVNTTSYSLTNALIAVTLFDTAGTPVIDGDTFVTAEILPPTASAPFGLLFVAPPEDFASHQVTVLRGEAAEALSAGYVVLETGSVEGAPSGSQFEVSGSVRNPDLQKVASDAVVIVTTYDAEGQVTGFRQERVEGGALAPGETTPFRIRLTPHSGVPADFSLIAFGRAPGE
jgi:LysM repeat protein